jgi:hypothetical protein
VRAESSGTRNGSNNRGAIAIVKPQTWLDYLLTDRSQFDILVFDPGWWGIGCHSINYIGAISSRCSAVRLRGRSRRARSSIVRFRLSDCSADAVQKTPADMPRALGGCRSDEIDQPGHVLVQLNGLKELSKLE